jgi:hypothetical protein
MLRRYGNKAIEESLARADELAAQKDYDSRACRKLWRSQRLIKRETGIGAVHRATYTRICNKPAVATPGFP